MVATGRVLFDSAYTTAVIIDESDRAHFVPIKSVVGDHFLAEIEKQIYVFSLKGARILTKRQTATRTFRFIIYETSHFLPLSPSDNKELELVLEKNQLPKVNLRLFSVLKELGLREKKSTDNKLDNPHKLSELIDEISQDEDRYTEQVRNMKEYLSHLKIEEIVTPVRKMADFLDEQLFQTDPAFYGEVVSRFKRTDTEHKIIMNKPVGTKKHLFKWVAIILFMVLIVAAVFLLFGKNITSGGAPPDLTSMIPGFGGITKPGEMSMQDFQKIYPTPEAAKKAVDNGQLSYEQIPAQLRDFVRNAKPVVTPVETAPVNHEIAIKP